MDANPASRSRPSTPPSYQPQQSTRLPQTTPRRIITTATKTFARYPLFDQRNMLITDLGASVPCASLDFFEDKILPKLERGHKEEIFKRLQEKGSFCKADPSDSESRNRWKSIPFVPKASGALPGKETDLYTAFETTCTEILTEAKAVLNRTPVGQVRDTATIAWKSESPQCKFRSDCDMVRLKIGGENVYSLSDIPKQPDAANVIVNMEFKMKEDEKKHEDNDAKIILAASHILYNDPRRRFTFSLGMEGSQIRLWWHSRSIVVASRTFDIFEEPKRFIHFIVAMAFGSDDEVGYDPTVVRIPPSDGHVKIRYKFWIRKRFDKAETTSDEARLSSTFVPTNDRPSEHGRWYISKKCVSSYKAHHITGRGTRVWVVYDENDPTETDLVLKDVWLSSTAQSEWEIQQAIFADMGRNVKAPLNFKDYFMTIFADEEVMIDGRPDKTAKEIIEPHSLPLQYTLYPLFREVAEDSKATPANAAAGIKESGSVYTFATKHTISNGVRESGHQYYEARSHRRVLFKEYGLPLHDLTDQKLYLGSVIQAISGLKCLHSAGWVHRDLSTGNLLLCDNMCKISDLEYARSYEDLSDASQATKSGTPEFMAVEIQMGERLCFADLNPRVMSLEDRQRAANERLKRRRTRNQALSGSPIRHNFIHDLESMFWIALWFILTTIPPDFKLPDTDLRIQYSMLSSLFPHLLEGHPQRVAFVRQDPDAYTDWVLSLPSLFQDIVNNYWAALQTIRQGYSIFEMQEAQNLFGESFVPFYDDVANCFAFAQEYALEQVVPLPPNPKYTEYLEDEDGLPPANVPTRQLPTGDLASARGVKRRRPQSEEDSRDE